MQLLPEYVALADSDSPWLRRAAIDLLGGFTIATTPAAKSVLDRLLHDRDWRVRRDAEALLADESLLPDGYSPPWPDRLRRLFTH